MENPETLWSDTAQIGGKPTTTNLHTDDCDSWHRAICKHYKYYDKQGICKGRQIQLKKKEGDNNNTFLTVNVYQTGTVMFQGSEAGLISVKKDNIFKETGRVRKRS